MTAEHLEILVEEPSMEALLKELLPRMLDGRVTFRIVTFQGKADLLAKLPARLRGYAAWLPNTHRIIVVVDQDDDDCRTLKRTLEDACQRAGLVSRTAAKRPDWRIVTRIVVEELESWYFGDWDAVRRSYPRVKATVPKHAYYRVPDTIAGGTWEAFQRVMQEAGYFKGGLRKIEAARAIGSVMDPISNRSVSFQAFRTAVLEALV